MTDTQYILFLDEVREGDRERIGSKAYNLALLRRQGFSVPSAFCVTTDAFAGHGAARPRLHEQARAAIVAAYERLGAGAVAVRSSALAEDTAASSFAGQHLTELNVTGAVALLGAIARCAASLGTEAALAYRARRGAQPGQTGTGVLVQRMLAPERAGVMFTANPVTGVREQVVIETVAGPGSGLVDGTVTPARYVVDTRTGAVTAADAAGNAGALPEVAVRELAGLGKRIEELFEGPQDIEWARSAAQCWLLQARPITTLAADSQAYARDVRSTELERLAGLVEKEVTVWSSFNLAETLPAPTPLTWSVLSRHFLSGSGAMGQAYRMLGYRPDRALDEVGIIDLVFGRPYYNLSREPRLYFAGFPFEHAVDGLRADPGKALYPTPTVNLQRAGPSFLLRFPASCWRMVRAERRQARLLGGYDAKLREQYVPAFDAWVRTERARALRALPEPELLAVLAARIHRTLVAFGCCALAGGLLAGKALAVLRARLQRANADLHEVPSQLLVCPEHDPNAAALRWLADVGRGERGLAEFLERFGHRTAGEFELARPRWREAPESVRRQAAQVAARPPPAIAVLREAHARHRQALLTTLPPRARPAVERDLDTLLRYLPFREQGKFQLMRGYELVRGAVLEIARRTGLHDDIFFLKESELPELLAGRDFGGSIAERKRRRAALLAIAPPPVLFSDELDAIGTAPARQASASDALTGVGVSAGRAAGPALVLADPAQAPDDAAGFVLVCPAADPGWTPLLARAAGLVLERGGVLSHSAIVAREFGIPAVAGITDATRRIRAEASLEIDGTAGEVRILEA